MNNYYDAQDDELMFNISEAIRELQSAYDIMHYWSVYGYKNDDDYNDIEKYIMYAEDAIREAKDYL